MQSALVIDVADEKISVPRFTVGDYAEWGAELDAQKRTEVHADLAALPAKDRLEARLTHRIVPTDFSELAVLAYTPGGVKRIIDRCFGRAKVIARAGQSLPAPEPLSAERAAGIIEANTANLPTLARMLAGLIAEQEPPKDEGAEQEKPADPLPIGGSTSAAA